MENKISKFTAIKIVAVEIRNAKITSPYWKRVIIAETLKEFGITANLISTAPLA